WGDKFFERFYKPFFDPSDGLYRGQATFCDIHFPGKCSSGYPQEWSIADCLHCKPLGTNSLYVLGMAAMAEACEALGEIDAAADWSQQRQHLIDAITSELRREDGTLAYYKRGDGQLEERRDALGTGLAIIAGVVTGDEAATLITSYPRHWWGAPMYEPFFPFANSYHNRTSWPFVDAVFLWAEAIATGRDTAPEQAAWLARAIHPAKGGFAEVAQPDGTPFGSGHQLWSAAGFINAALRGGWVCA
ncbi:MAG: hypothetical protein PF961_20110, partial [Planctomycetota bacterium]|nr:hypothetical protein [Planctomycetota bacterium]